MKIKINGEYQEVGFFGFFRFYLISWFLMSLIFFLIAMIGAWFL